MDRAKIVVGQCGGILAQYEIFYIRFIKHSAERSLACFDRFCVLAKAESRPELAVYELQEAVAHAAAVSRYFWPSGKDPLHKARGNRLRKAFGIEEASPIKSRTVRNAAEHFDERLDKFLLGDVAGNVFDILVGASELAEMPATHILRLASPEGSLVLLGETIFFPDMKSEIHRILERADEMDRSGGRLSC